MGRVIEIPRSKRKMGLLLVGALAFVVLGILFVINPEQWVSARHESTGFIRIAGGVQSFSLGGVVSLLLSIFSVRSWFAN
jgi:hypothetical protein